MFSPLPYLSRSLQDALIHPFSAPLLSSFAVFLPLFSPSDHHFPLGPPFWKGDGGTDSADEATTMEETGLCSVSLDTKGDTKAYLVFTIQVCEL